MSTEISKKPDNTSTPSGRYQEALSLWLRWHDAYERITQAMFEVRHDQERLESMLDQLDQLRKQAVLLSRELVDHPTD